MFRSIFVFTCALAATACGGSDNKTAQDPSQTTVTSAPSDPNLSAQPTTTSPTDSTSSTGASSTGNTTAQPTTGQTGSSTNAMNNGASNNANNNTAPSNMNNTPPSTQAPPPAYGNPGSANGTANADNTKINDRDRHGALTPVDQGNSKAETDITASIRKAVVGTKGLSFNAKNVKIITTGTKVTLRGPVASDQEKSTIENLARQAAGVTTVDDQIEIKK